MPRPLVQRARQLRREQTPFEAVLWKLLRENKVEGFNFRRQHPIDRFIADFACPSARLIIELDGASHDERLDRDAARDEYLKGLGWITLRFQNADLMRSPKAVWLEIERHLVAKTDSQQNL